MFLSYRTKETCFTFNNVENISAKTRHCEVCFKTNPANIYLPKVNNRNTRKGMKYVQWTGFYMIGNSFIKELVVSIILPKWYTEYWRALK